MVFSHETKSLFESDQIWNQPGFEPTISQSWNEHAANSAICHRIPIFNIAALFPLINTLIGICIDEVVMLS